MRAGSVALALTLFALLAPYLFEAVISSHLSQTYAANSPVSPFGSTDSSKADFLFGIVTWEVSIAAFIYSLKTSSENRLPGTTATRRTQVIAFAVRFASGVIATAYTLNLLWIAYTLAVVHSM